MSCESFVHYRDVITDALARGCQLASLYASGAGDDQAVRAVLLEPDGALDLVSVAVRDGHVPSVVDLAPAVEWSEREAHDLHRVYFDGHEPMRPLIDHSGDLPGWTVPVDGPDAYQIAVGPIHAGVIESGHFRLHVVGDRILHLDVRLFYKHRGLERTAIGKPLRDAIDHAARACGACAVTNRVAYARAAEQIYGLRPTAEVARARSLLLELERLWSHLNDIAAICSGAGLAAGNQRFAALCESARQLNSHIAGHRLLFNSVHVGGSHLDVPERACRSAREVLARLEADTKAAWRDLVFNASFQDRLIDIGILSPPDALLLGAVGPVARGSGIPDDARTSQEGWLTYDGFEPAIGHRASGDVRARFEQRELELRQTFGLLKAPPLRSWLTPAQPANARLRELLHASRVPAAPRSARSKAAELAGIGSTSTPARTRTGPSWPASSRVTSCPISP